MTPYAANPANVVSSKIVKNILLKNSTLFLFSREIPVGGGGGRAGLCQEQRLAVSGVHTPRYGRGRVPNWCPLFLLMPFK